MEDACPWCTWQCDRWSPLASVFLHTPDLLDLCIRSPSKLIFKQRQWRKTLLIRFQYSFIIDRLTWANDENMAEAGAGVYDCWASGHGLRPFLWLKCLKTFFFFFFLRSQFNQTFLFHHKFKKLFLLLPACLHEWSPCPFQPWPGANRHERCEHEHDKSGNALGQRWRGRSPGR